MLIKVQIPINELRIESHHRGRVLAALTVTESCVQQGLISIVEDSAGSVATVTIFNQDDRLLSKLLPCGSVIAIKEPYCKYNGPGDFVIRVDHPSDIHIWAANDGRVPAFLWPNAPNPDRTAAEWMDLGNKAFLAKEPFGALQWLVSALVILILPGALC